MQDDIRAVVRIALAAIVLVCLAVALVYGLALFVGG